MIDIKACFLEDIFCHLHYFFKEKSKFKRQLNKIFWIFGLQKIIFKPHHPALISFKYLHPLLP